MFSHLYKLLIVILYLALQLLILRGDKTQNILKEGNKLKKININCIWKIFFITVVCKFFERKKCVKNAAKLLNSYLWNKQLAKVKYNVSSITVSTGWTYGSGQNPQIACLVHRANSTQKHYMHIEWIVIMVIKTIISES